MTQKPLAAATVYQRLEDVVSQQLGDSFGGSQLAVEDDANRRVSFRCAVQPDKQRAVLSNKSGWRKRGVRLVDQSAGGFGVVYSGTMPFEEGQELRLKTVNGGYWVRIVRLESDGDSTRAGLERMGDIIEPELSSGSLSVGTLFLVIVFASAVFFRYALSLH